MPDYEIQLKAEKKIKKYSDRIVKKIGSVLWMEDNKIIHNIRRNIDKLEKTLSITNKKIIKKLDVFCMHLESIGFYINGNTPLYDDGEVLSNELGSFNERQKSIYKGFRLKSYNKAYNFELIGDNFSSNKRGLINAMERYIISMEHLRKDHKNLKRFLRVFDTLTIPTINKMSKEELISYFRRRKIKISPTN